MTGVITALFNRGPHGSYGFIHDEEGNDRFFQPKNLINLTIGDLEKGAKVEFIPVKGGRDGNGLRAENIQLA